LIEAILAPGVAVAESFAGPAGDSLARTGETLEHDLFPEECRAIADAVPSRRAEFALGRHCARQALAALGAPRQPILPGPTREPLWPPGFVGSITHCSGYCAAAVGRSDEFRTVGIDAEPDEPLPPGVLDEIALPGEADEIAASREGNPDRRLFCAKEAVYKAWFPVARRWLGFEEASIAFAAGGTFQATILVSGPVASMTGRWVIRDGLIVAAIAEPIGRPASTAPST